MSETAVILGCGPAGLFAAWAAELRGMDIRIISKKRRSELFGAQYLHKPIPYLEENFPELKVDSTKIEYYLMGTADGYRRRVYGPTYSGTVSPEEYAGVHKVWDIRATYNYLYSFFEKRIMHVANMDGATLRHAMRARDWDVDWLINSIPLPSLCLQLEIHKFNSRMIWAIGDAPDRGQRCPVQCPENMVVCNGEPLDNYAPSWYRASNIFGHRTAEWTGAGDPSIYSGLGAMVTKPINNTCDCFPEMIRVGRYGTWRKGVLSHHAYEEAEKAFNGAS